MVSHFPSARKTDAWRFAIEAKFFGIKVPSGLAVSSLFLAVVLMVITGHDTTWVASNTTSNTTVVTQNLNVDAGQHGVTT